VAPGEADADTPSTTKVDGLSASVPSQRLGKEKDLLQPFKKDGTVNDAFVSVYGKNARAETKDRSGQCR
jgi:hypothetical protein